MVGLFLRIGVFIPIIIIDSYIIVLRIGGYAVSMLHVTSCLVRDWSAYST
jgi:hypothetical protein